ILTDSGGYQVFSLAKLRKITEEGVHFQNHIDGTPTFISPEIAMEIQTILGSDIAMVLDECAPYPCEYDYAARSAEMTARWAVRCKRAVEANAAPARTVSPANPNAATSTAATTTNQILFGIVQGATFDDLRKSSAKAIVHLDSDGFAIGGVAVADPQEKMRYARGLGSPPQLLENIARGMDMFDCVLPTRLARNGTAFTASGTTNLKNAEFALDKSPIEENCECPACREFTRGYVRHLIKAEEILGLRLITLHNLHF